MSTQYEIVDDGAGSILEFSEESGKIMILLHDEALDSNTSTCAVFTEEDLIQMCVKILKIASYIAENPETVRAKLHNAIARDSYLGGMKY